MYEELFKLIKKPSLWQRSSEPFWDDAHISKMMLESHLNSKVDAASRRLEIIDRSVKWLATLIPPCGKILDLGCGPGLYAKRLSEIGYNVTGVDLSKRSILYAKEMDHTTKYICQDYLTLDDTATYDAILLIYCDYAALTKPEREKLLAKVYRMLNPNGLFIFDVFTDAFYKQKKDCARWRLCENGGFWSAEPYVCLEANYLFENNTVSANQYVVITKDQIKEHIIWDTAYTNQRLADEVQPFGFFVKAIFGDVCGTEYHENSETLCCIAAKRETAS